MLAGTRPLMFGALVFVAVVFGLGYEYNTHLSLLEAQEVAQSCDTAIWSAIDVLANNLLGQANRSITTRLGLMASAILLDERDSPIPLANVGTNRTAQDVLRRHLWAVTRSYMDSLNMFLFVGFVQPLQSYTAYLVLNTSYIRYLCAPCPNASLLVNFPLEVASYEVDSDGNLSAFSDFLFNVSGQFQPNATLRTPSGTPLPHLHAVEYMSQWKMTLTMTTPAMDASGQVVGVLAVQSVVDLIGERLQLMVSEMILDDGVLFLLLEADYYVIWINQDVPVLDGDSRLRVDQLGDVTLASLGEALISKQCGNGSHTWSWTTNTSGLPERYVVRVVEIEVGWLLVLALPEQAMYRIFKFEPSALFHRLVVRSISADIANGTVVACVVIAGVLLYSGLLMRPNNHLEAFAKPLVIVVVPCFVGMLITVVILLNGAAPAEEVVLEDMCETSMRGSGEQEVAWHSVIVARSLEDQMLTLMLANELLLHTTQMGLLQLDNVDSSAAQQGALFAFQWRCVQALPPMSWVYWGARYTYGGYELLLNGSKRLWTNAPLQSGQQSASTALWFLANSSTGAPYGGPVYLEYNYYLQGEDFYVEGLKFARNIAYATEIAYQGDSDGLSLTFLRFVPGVPGGTELGMVAAAEYSPGFLNAILQTVSIENGVVYAIDIGSKALLCANVPLTLMVNGNPVTADESENALVRSSFTRLKDQGFLLAWVNASFEYSYNGNMYLCSLMPTFAKVNGLDVLVVSVLAFSDWKAKVSFASSSWRVLRQQIQALEIAFLFFGGLSGSLGILLLLTVYGVIAWKKKLKNPALVEKMLWDTQPSEHRVPEISLQPPVMGVLDFCQQLPRAHFPDSTPPHPKSISRMLRLSALCLQRRGARHVIRECCLTEDEALAVCVYTSELQPGSLSEAWFSLPSATFQIYREMNAALRSQDEGRIQFWHPLLHPLMAGLRKMRHLKEVPPDDPPTATQLWRRLFWRKKSVVAPYFIGPTPPAEADRTLYRGIALSARLYHPGDRVVWAAFSSCSYSLGVAKSFCNALMEEGPVARTMFFLEAHSGVRISALSHFPREEEVLLLPGTSFRVGNCGCEKFDKFANGVRFIELIEESPQGADPMMTMMVAQANKDEVAQKSRPSPLPQVAPVSLLPADANPCRRASSSSSPSVPPPLPMALMLPNLPPI